MRVFFASPLSMLLCPRLGLSSAFIAVQRTSQKRCLPLAIPVTTAATSGDEVEVIRQAAFDRSVPSSRLVPILESLQQLRQEAQGDYAEKDTFGPDLIEGTFELVFSSAVAKIPLVGSCFDGYLPNLETITFDLQERKLLLTVETLPFIPKIDIVGENLSYNETSSSLQYTVQGKSKASSWDILHVDEDVIAAKSSVTGLNIIRRL